MEDQPDRVALARDAGLEVLDGNAALLETIGAANVPGATRLIIAIPDGFDAGGILRTARALNPGIEIVARAYSDSEVEHLRANGANFIIMGEREVARGMLNHVLSGLETADDTAHADAGGNVVPMRDVSPSRAAEDDGSGEGTGSPERDEPSSIPA